MYTSAHTSMACTCPPESLKASNGHLLRRRNSYDVHHIKTNKCNVHELAAMVMLVKPAKQPGKQPAKRPGLLWILFS
jgi:hypothetical protein